MPLSSSVSFHNNIKFALNKHIPTIEEPDSGAPSNFSPTRRCHPLASSNSNPTSNRRHTHIQSNLAELLPSICPFVRGFRRLLYLKSQSMGRVKNIKEQDAMEEQDAVQVSPRKDHLDHFKKQVEMMKAEGVVNKISTTVAQVTEEIVVAVLDLYPTLLFLSSAYSLLESNKGAQEEMLRRQSNNVINAGASRNIFQLVWGN